MTTRITRSSEEIMAALYTEIMSQDPPPVTEDEAAERMEAMLDADEALYAELQRAIWLERLPAGRAN
jgi:hypothetical protein